MLAETATKGLHFVICNECFWCATLFGATHRVGACPACSKSTVEFLPLSHNERYTFDYNQRTGVVLEFSIEAKARTHAA